MSASLLRRVRGPAYALYRNAVFYTKDAQSLAAQLAPFMVTSDQYGDVDSRINGRAIKTTFTPLAWTPAALAALFPFAQFVMGQYNTPVSTIASVNTGTSVLTTAIAHGQISGDGVRIACTGTIPTGLSATTTYYVNVISSTTVKLYDTAAHAVAGGGTGLIAPSTAGTGTIIMIQNTPLIIQCFNGTTITLWNTAITKMPSLDLSAVKQPFGAVEFESYTLHGQMWSDNNSLFTIGTGSATDTSFDPTQIPTVPYTAQFGSTAPFTDLEPKDGVKIDFDLQLEEVPSDANGLLCRSIKGVSATAKLRPVNLTEADLWGEILLQGTGAARGASLPSAELDIFGPTSNPYIALYGATFQDAPLKIGAQEDRIDTITFKTKRTFASGAPLPVFYVGTSAPS